MELEVKDQTVTDIDQGPNLNSKEISKLIRKLDIRLIPYLALIYLFSFLDRVNLGYAKIYKIEEELNLSHNQYSWSLSIFFVGYILFEVPSNLILKKATPSRWITRIMVTWGAITISSAFVKNFEGLMCCRFFLGIAEAGLFPGIVYYLSFWYTRKEQGLRIALFFSSASLSGAFSGLLAYCMNYLDKSLGLSAWQWLFIIEGIPSCLLGILTWWILPNTPETANWLSLRERSYLVNRLLKDHTDSSSTKFRKDQLIEAITDYKVYLYMLSYFGIICPVYSMAQLLPTIIKDMGFSKLKCLLLVTPPYAIGCITVILVSYNSDKKKERCFHLCGACIIAVIGYLIMILANNKYLKYFGTFLSVSGAITSTPVLVAWLNSNMLGSTKSGAASAMVVSFGTLNGIVAGQLFKPIEAPRYTPSLLVNTFSILLTLIFALILRYFLTRENKFIEQRLKDKDFNWNRTDGLNIKNFRYSL